MNDEDAMQMLAPVWIYLLSDGAADLPTVVLVDIVDAARKLYVALGGVLR